MRNIGFTLIELLVVIVIIAILIAVLASGLQGARLRVRTIVCGSNIRQLSLALTAYDQEYGTFPHGFDLHGLTPPPGDFVGDAAYDKMGWWWFHSLADTMEDNFDKGTVLWCPSRNIKNPVVRENILCGNYGVNRSICKDTLGVIGSEFVGTPLGLHKIRRPAGTLLITDSGYSLISWYGVAVITPPDLPFENQKREGAFYIPGLKMNTGRIISSGFEQDAVKGRHPNRKVNVGFADGHLSRLKADSLFVEKSSSGYNNRFPLWRPK